MLDFQKRDLFEERAFLVGLSLKKRRRPSGATIGIESSPEESLDELRELAISAGLRVVGEALETVGDINARTFVGKGQAERIGADAGARGADVVIFDEDLSPSQNRTLEEVVDHKVIDRTGLILDIFAQRAKTAEGQLQVELAQLNYLAPRLVGLWKHFGRIKGGIGLRGPGETQLEIDRRRIRERITKVRRELEKVRRSRDLQRQKRRGVPIPTICLVGYTNSGKSTLLNALSGSSVATANLLFATLDPTTRKIRLPDYGDCLVTDTVGFIRKLPHQLVDAFKATLEEVTEADLLGHVVDMSHPAADAQIRSVQKVLVELSVEKKATLVIFNKMDRLSAEDLQAFSIAHSGMPSVMISARESKGLEELARQMSALLKHERRIAKLRIPLSQGRWISAVRARGHVIDEKYTEKQVRMTVEVEAKLYNQLEKEGFVQ